LTSVPGGMILSGLFLGGMMIVGIIIGCLILTGILKLAFKRTSFLTILFITTTISFAVFHYQLYSPTLTIKVPNGYKGEINLVLSNVKDNILTVDSNGIGYLNEWTFNKTYSRPIVEQLDGKNLIKI
jgi:membrane protein implicated in regulation of membrane protease activity